MTLRAVIFDFDGLILDTETPEFLAWQEAYAAAGASLDARRWSQLIGTMEPGWSPRAQLEEHLGHPVDRASISARHLALIDAEVARPGVEAWLAGARELGLLVGLASSSGRPWVTTYLKRLGILDLFAAIATGDRVPRTKPDPAVYRLALSELGVAAADAIAVEDSPNGIAAAKAAGLYVVAVPNGMTAGLDLSAADVTLGSLADRTIAEVACQRG